MGDELSIRLRLETEDAKAAVPAAAASSAAEGRLGTSGGFNRASRYWTLNADKIEERVFHHLGKSLIKGMIASEIGEIIGASSGSSFISQFGGAVAGSFAFGGPTMAAIVGIHHILTGIMERLSEQARDIAAQAQKVENVKLSITEARKDDLAKERQRDEEFARKARELEDRFKDAVRQEGYRVFQYVK